MAKPRDSVEFADPSSVPPIPPPIEGGTDHLESLGLIDKVMGSERIEERALTQVLALSKTENSTAEGDEAKPLSDSHPEDPPPVEIPPPVDDGTDYDTRDGGRPKTN